MWRDALAVADVPGGHRIAEDVQLHVLSGLVNLSRSYFSRAFKTSTGLAPHQWLLQARIARAKELMLEGDRPLAQIAMPGEKVIDPRLNREEVDPEAIGCERATPAIVRTRRHPHFAVAAVGRVPMKQHDGDHVMAVGEGIGLDDDGVAHDPLRGREPSVDLGLNSFDDDASPAFEIHRG